MRLNKYIANSINISRRSADKLIKEGEITLNGKTASIGQSVVDNDIIKYKKKTIKVNTVKDKIYILMYNKPLSQVCTKSDEKNRETVFSSLPKCPLGKWISVGRLDINTSGLLLFTNSGELSNNLMHPKSEVTRTYRVRVLGTLGEKEEKKLSEGVTIDNVKCRFNSFKKISVNSSQNQWYELTVHTGKYRMIRRMFESIDCKVSRLVRTGYGSIFLPKSLGQGESRFLDEKEIKKLRETLKK